MKLNWKSFKDDYHKSLKYSETEGTEASEEIDELILKGQQNSLTTNAIAYYAGYCVYKKVDCKRCSIQLLKSDVQMNADNVFISEKFFKKDQNSNFGSLKAPSDEMLKVAEFLVNIFEAYFTQKSHINNICEEMAKFSLVKIKSEFPTFLPEETEPCFAHFNSLLKFFLLVLLRKNCKWLVPKKNIKEKSKLCKTSKKLRILTN